MTIILQMLFCFIGATIRYAVDHVFKKSVRKTFKSYRNYDDKPENEFVDKILGLIVFFALVGFIIRLL